MRQTQTSYPQALPPIRCCCLSDTASVKPSFNQTTNSRGVNGQHLAPNTFSPHTHQGAGRDLNPVTHRLTATSDSSSAALKEAGDLARPSQASLDSSAAEKASKRGGRGRERPHCPGRAIRRSIAAGVSRVQRPDSETAECKDLKQRLKQQSARTWNSRVQGSGTALETAECKDPKQQSPRT